MMNRQVIKYVFSNDSTRASQTEESYEYSLLTLTHLIKNRDKNNSQLKFCSVANLYIK